MPHADPVDREYIRPTQYPGVFAIDPVWDKQMPTFAWGTLYAAADAMGSTSAAAASS